MVENGDVDNGRGWEHARAHTFHHYRKKASNVSNIYENPMSVKRSAEALAGRYATFPRAAEPQHKLSTASGMYEMPLDDWPGDATDDRKISSVSSYYESPELHPDLKAARGDGDVLGLRKESGVYEIVEPMSSKRYRSNPDLSGILEDGEDIDRRRKSTVYDAPMPELPPGVARRPSPVPELSPRQNSLSPKSGVATIPEPLPRDSPERTPKLPPRDTSTRPARRVSTPKMSPRDALYQNYGIKNDGDDDNLPFSDDGVPPCPFGDAPALPVGAVPARPSGDAPSPPSSRAPPPPTSAAPTLPGPMFPDGVAPPFQEDLAPTFPEEGATPAPRQTPGMRTPLPAYLTRDRADSVGSMDTLASEALSERQTHFEMRKIDFDFIPAPDYPEDDVLPPKHARSQSVQGREDDPYRRFDYETDNVTFIS
ncbi:hypothetical protein Bbelb_238890 [Branchiostoma belcheri]|nr:hypothetical protein Bbelb_238890 [Branchiostoma belcheri]